MPTAVGEQREEQGSLSNRGGQQDSRRAGNGGTCTFNPVTGASAQEADPTEPPKTSKSLMSPPGSSITNFLFWPTLSHC